MLDFFRKRKIDETGKEGKMNCNVIVDALVGLVLSLKKKKEEVFCVFFFLKFIIIIIFI